MCTLAFKLYAGFLKSRRNKHAATRINIGDQRKVEALRKADFSVRVQRVTIHSRAPTPKIISKICEIRFCGRREDRSARTLKYGISDATDILRIPTRQQHNSKNKNLRIAKNYFKIFMLTAVVRSSAYFLSCLTEMKIQVAAQARNAEVTPGRH